MENINILWFKRDFRLTDHEALYRAVESNRPLIMLFVLESVDKKSPYYDERHLNFILQSIEEINLRLKKYEQKIYAIKVNWISFLEKISAFFKIEQIFSHQETGLDHTFQRDIATKKFCKEKDIIWNEYPQQAVIRGAKNRKRWDENWRNFMFQDRYNFDLDRIPEQPKELKKLIPKELHANQKGAFQKGGRSQAVLIISSFFKSRHKKYMRSISKPSLAELYCSRLSPYIAWGNISIREVYQSVEAFRESGQVNKRGLTAFQSRLVWHCHMIQKLETEPELEYKNMNPSFNDLRAKKDNAFQKAFFEGQTGFPMIDASIRCLKATGYLNFRMRACLVSFFTHHGWQDWQDCSPFLGSLFLDFEPGIHLYQHQMQACTIGVHTIRTYNPEKQAVENDPEAIFIKKWIPELRHLPVPFAQRPYSLTLMEQQFYDMELGKNYPYPILNLKERGLFARNTIHNQTKKYETQLETKAILKKHMR